MSLSAFASAGGRASGAQPKYMAGGRGMSESMQSSREQEQRRFDEFLSVKGLKPYDRMEKPDDLCNRKMIEQYKDYLAEDYRQQNGKHYSPGTAMIFLNTRMQAIKDKLKSKDLHRATGKQGDIVQEWLDFDRNPYSDMYQWMQGMRHTITLGMRKRAAEEGEATDFSQEPIYPTHIKSMAAAYDRAGTTAAYDRRAALVTAMMVSGRSSEIKYIHLDVMKWDEHYDCLMVDVQQVKVGEHKVAALVAGTSPHQCFYDAIGAKLAMSRAEPVPADAVHWLFPEFQAVKHAGKKLGGYIKSLCPGAGGLYKDHAVASLPDGANAGGIRVGCVNVLLDAVPEHHAAQATGHKLTGRSAIFEYAKATRPVAMSGAVVLAGWQPFEWGRLGAGPWAPKLADLAVCAGSGGTSKLVELMDRTLQITMMSPEKLQQGPKGKLRPMVEVCFTTLVRHYEARYNSGSGTALLSKMRDHWADTYRGSDYDGLASAEGAHKALMAWSRDLQGRFKSKNARLQLRQAESLPVQLQASLQGIQEQLDTLRDTIGELQQKVARMEHSQSQGVDRLCGEMSRLRTGMSETARQAAVAAVTVAESPKRHSAPVPDISPAAGPGGDGGSDAPQRAGDAAAEAMHACTKDVRALLQMQQTDRTSTKPQSADIAGLNAPQLFLQMVKDHGAHVPDFINGVKAGRSQRNRLGHILKHFSAMATQDEIESIQRAGGGAHQARMDAVELSHKLNDLVVQRLAKAFKDDAKTVPPSLKKLKKRNRTHAYKLLKLSSFETYETLAWLPSELKAGEPRSKIQTVKSERELRALPSSNAARHGIVAGQLDRLLGQLRDDGSVVVEMRKQAMAEDYAAFRASIEGSAGAAGAGAGAAGAEAAGAEAAGAGAAGAGAAVSPTAFVRAAQTAVSSIPSFFGFSAASAASAASAPKKAKTSHTAHSDSDIQ